MGVSGDEAARAFLDGTQVGDLRGGTVTAVSRVASVTLDGFPARPLGHRAVGCVLAPDPAGRAPEDVVQVGDTIAVVVTEIDRERRRVVLLPGAVG